LRIGQSIPGSYGHTPTPNVDRERSRQGRPARRLIVYQNLGILRRDGDLDLPDPLAKLGHLVLHGTKALFGNLPGAILQVASKELQRSGVVMLLSGHLPEVEENAVALGQFIGAAELHHGSVEISLVE